MVAFEFPTFCYQVDQSDRLLAVDTLWLEFAKENGAPELTRQFVEGRYLWDFFADDSTKALYAQIHRRVRETGKTVVVPARCDSPNLKRHMQLTISRGETNTLHYQSVVLRVELQPTLSVFEPTIARSADLLTLCSCCKKLLVEPRNWVELEQVAAKLHLFEDLPPPQLQYRVCPACTEAGTRTP